MDENKEMLADLKKEEEIRCSCGNIIESEIELSAGVCKDCI